MTSPSVAGLRVIHTLLPFELLEMKTAYYTPNLRNYGNWAITFVDFTIIICDLSTLYSLLFMSACMLQCVWHLYDMCTVYVWYVLSCVFLYIWMCSSWSIIFHCYFYGLLFCLQPIPMFFDHILIYLYLSPFALWHTHMQMFPQLFSSSV